MKRFFLSVMIIAACVISSSACTSFIIGKKASADGSVMVTYNADSYGSYYPFYYSPASKHNAGDMIDIYDRDTNEYRGKIAQVAETYNVTGYINEFQVSIGETTYGGREEMVDTTGVLDYGSLMLIALQRSKTAREAIDVMTALVEKYGYCSEGESFSICDPNEAWIMEMQGAGKNGVVWVAIRIPDDAICAHANQSRITFFTQAKKLNKKKNRYETADCIYSANCIKYARQQGWFNGKDADFSWNAAYAAPDFSGRRFCDARVWSFFNHFSDDFAKYIPWAEGFDKDAEPMPLWIIPNKKVSLQDVLAANRDHYEGTPFAVSETLGGGIWEMPYQPTPLRFELDGKNYFTERPISTQQTAFTFVSQLRSWLPRQIGGCFWYASDDGNMVAYTPIYCGNTEAPICYDDPKASDVEFSENSAFWMCNFVANMVYPRYGQLFPELQEVRDRLENSFFSQQAEVEKKAVELMTNKSEAAAVEYLTAYSNSQAEEMMKNWKSLAKRIIVRYNDMTKKKMENGKYVKTKDGLVVPVERPGYPKNYARRMIEQSKKSMQMPE